jgi:hypothetical protein
MKFFVSLECYEEFVSQSMQIFENLKKIFEIIKFSIERNQENNENFYIESNLEMISDINSKINHNFRNFFRSCQISDLEDYFMKNNFEFLFRCETEIHGINKSPLEELKSKKYLNEKSKYNETKSVNFFKKSNFLSNQDSSEKGVSLDHKLLLIEESLDEINFEIQNNPIANTSDATIHKNFLLKMKYFNNLKTFLKERREQKKHEVEIKKKEKMAGFFHDTLLKSRSFFGLLKWNKMIKYYFIIMHHYEDYKSYQLSKLFLNGLIHSYNRKKLIGSFKSLKQIKLKKKCFGIISNYIKYKSNHKKLYLSQLMNNEYCTKFLMICYNISSKKKIKIKERSSVSSNLKKLKIVNEIFLKRKIISILIENKNISEKNIYDKIRIFHNNQIKSMYDKYFFNRLRIIKNQKTKIRRYEKKVFLLRFFLKKFLKASNNNKLQYSQNSFQLFNFKSHFLKFLNNLKKQITSNTVIKKLKKRIFHEWKFLISLKRRYNLIKNKKLTSSRKLFFKNLKLNSIESLLIQGVIEKNKIYLRHLLVKLLFITSFYSLKLYKFLDLKKVKLKRKIFNCKACKKDEIVNNLKFLLKIFKIRLRNFYNNKIYFKQMIRGIREKTDKKIILIFLKLNKKFSNKVRKFKNDIMLKNIHIFFHFTFRKEKYENFYSNQEKHHKFFRNKFKSRLNENEKLKHGILRFLIKIIKRNTISLIKVKKIKSISKHLLLSKEIKIFLHKILKILLRSKIFYEIKNKIQIHFCQKFLNYLVSCSNLKPLNSHIILYKGIKDKRKIINAWKYFYMNRIKFYMLSDRLNEYILLKYLKKLHILSKNNQVK